MTPAHANQARRAALLETLMADESLSAAALARARLVAERTATPVEQVLNQMGVLSDDALAAAYATLTGCAVWDPNVQPVTEAALGLGVAADFLREKRLLPLDAAEDRVLVAACDPLDDEALAGLVFATGRTAQVLTALPSDWRRLFAEHHEATPAVAPADSRRLDVEIDRIADVGLDGAGARFVAQMMQAAVARGASDIHFEPRRHDLRVRVRLDGRLIEYQTAGPDMATASVSRIKVVANLDLGEKRLPQDGRATFVVEGRPVEVRVSIVPTVFGESAVLRLLDRHQVKLDLDALGFDAGQAELVRKVSRARHGIFLITGPTGSGKTTTLYAALNALAGADRKILSIEDPVEYHFDHVIQTQAAPAIGLTFASALRAFLRQDPDVILVGEIRDAETAGVALQAAMTGHLVLASVHANDALRVVPRLLDMGVEPYQLAAGLLGAAAQRLARRLCPHCRQPHEPTATERAFAGRLGQTLDVPLLGPVGCPACAGIGFRGRVALVEAFLADDRFLSALARNEPLEYLAPMAQALGLGSMAGDGLAKARAGLTSIDEVILTLSGA
jgi:general secretion pathway protein E